MQLSVLLFCLTQYSFDLEVTKVSSFCLQLAARKQDHWPDHCQQVHLTDHSLSFVVFRLRELIQYTDVQICWLWKNCYKRFRNTVSYFIYLNSQPSDSFLYSLKTSENLFYSKNASFIGFRQWRTLIFLIFEGNSI